MTLKAEVETFDDSMMETALLQSVQCGFPLELTW